MATFYFNHDSGESSESQWTRHIQNQGYVEDVTKSVSNSAGKQTKDFSVIVSRQTKEINDTIQSASREQVAAIQQSTNAICGTLESGFELLSDDLHEISYGIEELRSELNSMASMLDWKLSLLIEHQKITNLLLGNIAVLLRIPDIQKERQYHIEQGIKFLKNAIFDDDFYDDSLTNLLKAEKIEPADFFALHRIGLIFMYSPKHLDLKKAEDYFRKAAKYAVAESNSGASVTNNYLVGDLSKNLLEQTPTVDTIKLQAAESYLFAARSCYVQGKLNEAADLASKSFNLVPNMVEAGFMQAKALAANNDEIQAANILEKVINIDRYYSLKTLSDLDLCPKVSIQSLLKKLQKDTFEKAIIILGNCKQQMIQGSNAKEYIEKVERLLNKNTYLTSKKAIDLLDKHRNWNFCEPLKNSIQTNYLNEIIEMVTKLNKLKYCGFQPVPIIMNADFFDTFIKEINKMTQWNFPFYSVINSKSNWIENIKSKESGSNVVSFLSLEKQYNNDLPNTVSNLQNILQGYINNNNEILNQLENERREKDNENIGDSVLKGFLGGLGGIGVGLVAGFIIGLFSEIGSCISNGTEKGMNEYDGIIMISSLIICGSIGALGGYFSTRNKQ